MQAPIEEQWKAEIEDRRRSVSKNSLGHKSARDCWQPMRGRKIACVAYPCGKRYGAINNIPSDVTPSWRNALSKCRDYIHSGHIRFRNAKSKEHALKQLDAALEQQ